MILPSRMTATALWRVPPSPVPDIRPATVGPRDPRREPRELERAGLEERRAQQQVFGRVAAERQFGRDDQVRAAALARVDRVEDARSVAGEIADHAG